MYNADFYSALSSFNTDDLDTLVPERNITLAELQGVAEMVTPRLFVFA